MNAPFESMKTRFTYAGLCLALLMQISTLQAMNKPAVDEIIKLHVAGLGDETIVAFIKSKNYLFDLTADDAIGLRDKGLTSMVLSAMLSSGNAPSSPAAPPVVTSPPVLSSPPPPPTSSATYSTLSPANPPPPVAQPMIVSAPPAVVASPAANPDVAYFHQELSPHGKWFLVEDNRWCWQPTVVMGNAEWRPYWDRGHWVNTDQGWYWASDYPWGWAAFHYGRWNLHPRHGWIWFPDRVWASSWVVWRTGGDYCGWAPLPWGAYYDQASARFSYNGKFVGANFDFGLGWQHFNFSYTRELGETPRRHFVREFEARNVFNQTTIINRYSANRVVENNQTQFHMANRGPDFAGLPGGKGRSMEVVKLQEMQAPPPNRSHEHYNRDNRTMEVYRPRWGGH